MDGFKKLPELPGRPDERSWIRERLETLSEKESYILAAATFSSPPDTAADAINQLLSLDEYEVCWPASGYQGLGEFYLNYESVLPKAARPFIDLDKVGQWYEDQRPGLFIGDAYVQYPSRAVTPQYDGTNLDLCKDTGWSVRVKLASSAHPEGVWLRLPDYQDINDGRPDEVTIALHALGVKKVQECTVLDARCVLPQAGNLMEQYTSPADLIYDGNTLGIMLDERCQGMEHFEEKMTAALEYEDCRTLAFALDIIGNLSCYGYQPCEHFRELAVKDLTERGVPLPLIESGCVDLEGYALDLLDEKGYIMTGDESAFIARNGREFIYEYSSPEQIGPVMG